MNEYINEDGKRIFWMHEDDFYRFGKTWNTEKIKLKWSRIVWKILTDKKFRWHLKEVIFYAMRWEPCVRGEGSVEVFLFERYLEEIIEIDKER